MNLFSASLLLGGSLIIQYRVAIAHDSRGFPAHGWIRENSVSRSDRSIRSAGLHSGKQSEFQQNKSEFAIPV